jgi:peptide/nickel transport system permease protein
MSAPSVSIPNPGPEISEQEDRAFYATQSQLIWWKFRKHKLAVISSVLLLLLFLSAIFADFVAPYGTQSRFEGQQQQPPSQIRWFRDGAFFGPYIYGTKRKADPKTFKFTFVPDETKPYRIQLFARGEPYKMLGLIQSDIHLLGTGNDKAAPRVFLFGTDRLGRDIFSRSFHAARLSLSIPFVGVMLTFVVGMTLGGLSGYFGGIIDEIIQRLIDFIQSVPTIPLWIALAAALPREWSTEKTFLAITIILSTVSWTGLARVVRGKLLQLREEDYTLAAKGAGASEGRIIFRHLLPGFTSHLIVSLTNAVPASILGETALSFIGLGMQPPATSWGVLLRDAQNLVAIAQQPWTLIPALFVIATGLLFSFVGDGLRDAADPYTR